MEKQNREEKVQTTRLDLKTRICLMAAINYGLIDGISVDDAVEVAVDIENAANARVKKMKEDNPIFPKQTQRFSRRPRIVRDEQNQATPPVA